MSKGFAPILIILGIVLILGVVGGVYYFGKSFVKLPTSSSQITTSQILVSPTQPLVKTTISPTSTAVDETANWKSKSTKLLFFKYPSNWEESQDKETGGYTLIKPINNDKVWVGINDSTYTNQSETPEQLAKQALGNETPVNKKQTIVDGHSAVYQERHYPNDARIEVYIGDVKEMSEFPAQDGGPRLTSGTHSIFMEVRDLAQLETSKTIFNQILSTFRFTN